MISFELMFDVFDTYRINTRICDELIFFLRIVEFFFNLILSDIKLVKGELEKWDYVSKR